MFADHNPAIRAYAQANAEQFGNVGLFVLATIKAPLYRASRDCARILAGESTPERCPESFFSFKLAALDALRSNQSALYADCMALRESGADAAAITERIAAEMGFGLAKAGFYAQLALGVSGCLDTHNLERFGIDPRRFRYRPARGERGRATNRKRARAYVRAVERFGGTSGLWDSWCAYVAQYAKGSRHYYQSADHVSALHCHAFGIPAPFVGREAAEVPF